MAPPTLLKPRRPRPCSSRSMRTSRRGQSTATRSPRRRCCRQRRAPGPGRCSTHLWAVRPRRSSFRWIFFLLRVRCASFASRGGIWKVLTCMTLILCLRIPGNFLKIIILSFRQTSQKMSSALLLKQLKALNPPAAAISGKNRQGQVRKSKEYVLGVIRFTRMCFSDVFNCLASNKAKKKKKKKKKKNKKKKTWHFRFQT
jgi:hypothetical protein